MEAFVLKGKKFVYKRKNDSEQAVVRITPEAYNALLTWRMKAFFQ